MNLLKFVNTEGQTVTLNPDHLLAVIETPRSGQNEIILSNDRRMFLSEENLKIILNYLAETTD